MQIDYLRIGRLLTNCYIIHNNDGKCVLVDPAGYYDDIVEFLESKDLSIEAILVTHSHFDHVLAAGQLVNKYDCPIYCHELEKPDLLNPVQIFTPINNNNENLVPTLVSDQDEITTSIGTFKVIHTPGHTDGGVCYLIDNHLFTGDTLFRETIGRTDFARANHSDMMNSIINVLFKLDDNINVYPGHGQFSSIGHEKVNNQAI